MASRFTLPVPSDYLFYRDFCSYGYFLLAPNRWDPAARVLKRPLELSGGVAEVTVAQPEGKGAKLRVVSDRALSRGEKAEVSRLLTRMLSLNDTGVREFHRLDPRWRRSGRGRLMRSPTLFEDIIKTVTSCNVAWPSTIRMNQRLCEVVDPAFPSAAKLARVRPATLRARCSVGYRDKRIVELARLAASGEIDAAWFEDPGTPDEAVLEALIDLPGIGPYAAANIMQLLGRYHRLPLDTESVRHGRTVLGFEGTDKAVMARVAAHFEPMGAHRFRSYWFELWNWYEAKRGKSWTWDPATTGKSFTAAQF
ncbi:MAG: hypothetical protein J0L61_01215 [Planctomycetes bacterium]|nr:hypothetical protein [Planctomycetota bacterium]